MRNILLIAFFSTSFSLFAQNNRPKLVVGIVVDQMKNEYLQRFESKFSNDGFKRLIDNGFYSRNTHYNYLPTNTAPGHASIYTGTTPRYHGIISNNWFSRDLNRGTYCVGDTTASHVGGSAPSGNISPNNLQTNTITDQLKLTTNFQSKVVGISIKDRGSVLPAGHTPDGAYWYDSRTGEFMTSDYYTTELPAWVRDFNEKKLVDTYSNQVWETLLPIEEYTESTIDHAPYERGFEGKSAPTFPYDLAELRLKNGPYGLIRTTPFGNSLVLDMGLAAIEGEGLGEDATTDFLALSFSSTDYIGHNFGPNSIELEDTYVRLDREIGQLMDYLDEQIGEGEYLVFLTADHGVVANPNFLIDHKLPGGFLEPGELKNNLNEVFTSVLENPEWVLDVSNNQIFLDHAALGEKLEDVQQRLAASLVHLDGVLEVFTAADMARNDYTDPLRLILQNGYNRQLSGDVLFLLEPGYIVGTPGPGTTHGSGWTYDTHVPLIFYGKGVKNGSTVRKTTITDIAPTLSMLLEITIPNAAVTGTPIIEIFE